MAVSHLVGGGWNANEIGLESTDVTTKASQHTLSSNPLSR